MTAKSSKTTATIVGVVVLATLIWAGVSYHAMAPSDHPREAIEQVAGSTARDHLTIGVLVPLTGPDALLGQAIREGVILAHSESDKTVEIVIEDSRCEAQEAVNRVNKLISQDKIQAVIGDACLNATLASAPITEQHQVVLMNPNITDIRLTGAGSYLYRTIPTDDQAGKYTSRLLFNDGRRRLALISDDDPSSLAYLQSLKTSWQNYGRTVISESTMKTNQATTSNISLDTGNSSADALLLIAATPESASLMMAQANLKNSTLPVYGNDPFVSPAVISSHADVIENMVIIRPHQGDLKFQTTYLNTHGHSPLPYSAQAYDAFQVLVAAYDGQHDLKSSLDEISFVGTTGPIDFDALGNIGNNFTIVTIKDGQVHPVE